jgi:hypothetical protein
MARVTDKWKARPTDIPSPTQFSLRPTVKIAAQIHALTKMFPGRTKTDLINDLLEAGLSQAIDEITGEHELISRLGEDLTLDDYNDEGREFVRLFQEEKQALLDKVEEETRKKGGKE